jgi:hypothetical protein
MRSALRATLTAKLLAVVALVAALGAAPALSAQSGPGAAGTRAKRAAANAAAKTNAHTNAMQQPQPVSHSPNGGPATAKAAPQSQQTPAQAAKSAGAPGAGRSGDDASVSVRGGKDEVGFRREAFNYERSGRRDPFLSLLHSHDLRPMINDLKLVAVLYDPVGRSWAVMRDMTTKEQYRVKVGQQLGRMRVTQIHPKSVTFTIEEIGFSRQQTLALNDSKEREP